ncbi:MAG: proprotein convertase P-domain-containing protein, partial [Deltaproteobacteria bacterium]|nr:proprotein convertase P-domain-containing protein [Deltaproteobacteria bacterium]
HSPGAEEIALLKQYLLSGGRLYLEGGDFFFSDTLSDLHPFFNVKGVKDPAVKVPGPAVGMHFLNPLEYNYSQDLYYNFAIDSVEAAGGNARTILINGGDGRGLAAANEEAGYRTIASAILFSGLSEKGAGLLKEIMSRYILFLENGFPPCASHAQCDDRTVCTADACQGGMCVNDAIAECQPCSDDSVCATKKGCHPDAGYCVNIPGALFTSADTPIGINPGNPVAASSINVKKYGVISDLHVKVSITHSYRGDLRLKLSHNGKEIILKNPNGGDSADHVRATYDFIPIGSGSLDDFNGENLYGDWTLTVEDTEPVMNNGILKEWFIVAVYTPQPCPEGFVCEPDTGCVPGEVCKTYFWDDDGDGYGLTFDNVCVCEAAAPYTAQKGGDCDDANVNINPGASEQCNGDDDDCDGGVDEAGATGCSNYFKDADSDGFGLAFDKKCLCSPEGDYSAAFYGDCNDYDALVNPAATELCNGKDDDCNGLIDEGISCQVKYCFNDGFEWDEDPGWSATGLWHRIDAGTTIKDIYAEAPFN